MAERFVFVSPGRRGFTLVEIMIVVILIALLAAMVLPQFVGAAAESRENSLKMNLFRIRTQIEVYREQHQGQNPSLANFEAQMTMASNEAGETAPVGTDGYRLGPYLRAVPPNPETGGKQIGGGEPGTSDWYYDETTGHFAANHDAEAREW